MRKLLFASCLVFFSSICAVAADTPQPQPVQLPQPTLPLQQTSTAQPEYQIIKKYFQEGKIQEAKKLALDYLAQHPNDGDVRLVLGQIYMSEKNYAQAAVEFTTILAQYPNYTDARNLLEKANALAKTSAAPTTDYKTIREDFKKGKLSEAKKLALGYLAQHPNDGDVRLVLGQIYMSEKNYTQAAIEFTTILAQYPNYKDAKILLDRVTMLMNAKNVKAPELVLQQPRATSSIDYKTIREDFKKGKLSEAKKLALSHLTKHPDDGDVRLILGQIYMREKNYSQAIIEFNKILVKYPKYTDARKLLATAKKALVAEKHIAVKEPTSDYKIISNYFQKGQIEYAKRLALAHLAKYPNDADVRLVLGQIYLKEKNYPQATLEFQAIIEQYPHYTDAWVFLAEVALAENKDTLAMQIVNQGLKIQPNNPFLLNEKAKIRVVRFQYAIAGAMARQIIAQNPDNSAAISLAQETLESIKEVSPHSLYGLNEIGAASENDYVSDLHSTWDYSNFYYSRSLPFGRVSGILNYASRLDQAARQGELEFTPVINKYIYFDFIGGYANNPVLFPKWVFGGEGFFRIQDAFDFSLGEKYSFIQSQTYFNTLTGSLSKYFGNYWVIFQPYHFITRSDDTANFYIGTLRRYFNTDDEYISISAGYGRSPDLADLQNSNFIIIRNRFVSAGVEFPLFNHRIVVDIRGSYQHWIYPTPFSFVRDLSGGSIGLRYRF